MNRKAANKAELLDRIVADYTRRTRQGRAPEIANYKRKYPALADEIDDLLTSVAMIEGLKVQAQANSDTVAPSSNAKSVSQLSQLGDYVLIREVGRGGMGVVFEAVHQSLGRRVALKVMLEREFESEKQIARFKREAQSAARLHHTNIVSVFGVGEVDGYHFYVMEYIDGISLKSAVESLSGSIRTSGEHAEQGEQVTATIDDSSRSTVEQPSPDSKTTGTTFDDLTDFATGATTDLSWSKLRNSRLRYRWVADIGAQVADALAYSYNAGILHRDIKPANLMLDDKGQVWITDFGLVKLHDEAAITRTGDVIGTPQYLAPESLKGQYDQRSETYCLGLSLFEFATLKSAVEPGSHAEVFSRVIHDESADPSAADPNIPRDLATIISKAINKDPQQRYKSAEALRDDLRAFAEDRPISARRPSLFEQSLRWSRKNPLVATLATLSMFLVGAIAVVASSAWIFTNQAYLDLKIEAKRTEVARNLAEEKEQIAASNVEFMVDAFDGLFSEFLRTQTKGNASFDFDGFDELAGIEISIDARDADYLKKIASFYQDFARKNNDTKSLLNEASRSWRRVANVNFLIGETENAVQSYERAVAGYKELLKQEPESVQVLLDLVGTRSEMSNAIRRFGKGYFSLAPIKENIRTIESHPCFDHPEVQFALAQTLSASASAEVCRLAAEMEFDWDQLEIEMQKRGNRGRSRGGRRHSFLGFLWMEKKADKRYDDQVKRNVERAVSIAQNLAKVEPDNRDYQVLLGKCHCSLGALVASSGDFDAAEGSLNFAAEKFAQLANEFPDDADLQYQLAVAMLLRPSDPTGSETLKELEKVLEISKSLSGRNRNPEYRQLQIVSRLRLADWYHANGDPDLAIKQLIDAADLVISSDLKGMALRSMRKTIFLSSLQISRDLSPESRREFNAFKSKLKQIGDKVGQFEPGMRHQPPPHHRPSRGMNRRGRKQPDKPHQ